jgi:hypothetical protein
MVALKVFKSLIYVGIKPNSTKGRADWLYASKVAIALLEQSHKTSAEPHCPCFTASQSCNNAACLNTFPALPPFFYLRKSFS